VWPTCRERHSRAIDIVRSVRASFVLPAVVLVVVLGAAACGSSAPTPTSGSELPPLETTAPTLSEQATAAPSAVAGPWSATPLVLGDSQIAVVSDACAATAREKLGETEADLPTAVVDARGQGLVIAILSDGGVGIDCFAHLGDTGASVDGVDRLSVPMVEPVDNATTALTELTVIDDGATQRTVAFGRNGPEAAGVRLTLADGSQVGATMGDGWWAAWWAGTKRATKIESLDSNAAVVATTPAPSADVESRLAAASWWLDPAAPKPAADAMALRVLINEEACASGRSGADRVDPPAMEFDDTSITIRIDIRRQPGAQDCQGNTPFPFTLELPEALGNRALLDGSTRPPRDATKAPSS
jgi:hypothetical protein